MGDLHDDVRSMLIHVHTDHRDGLEPQASLRAIETCLANGNGMAWHVALLLDSGYATPEGAVEKVDAWSYALGRVLADLDETDG